MGAMKCKSAIAPELGNYGKMRRLTMALIDRASIEDQVRFSNSAIKIMRQAQKQNWKQSHYRYLYEVMKELELNLAWYSYGNGVLFIKDEPEFYKLNPKHLIKKVNRLIEPELNKKVIIEKFPTELWFDDPQMLLI
jgi:hypothetical protein